MNFVARMAAHGQRSAELPAARNFQTGRVIDVVRFPAFGIKQNLVPTDYCHLVSGGRAGGESALEGGGRKKIKLGVDLGLARWNIDMNGEAVEQIATPFKRLPAGAKLQSGEIDDWAVGRVLAGNPFRVVESEIAGAGGNLEGGVENFARRGGCIDLDGDSRR